MEVSACRHSPLQRQYFLLGTLKNLHILALIARSVGINAQAFSEASNRCAANSTESPELMKSLLESFTMCVYKETS